MAAPEASVVVAAFCGAAALERCLASLEPQSRSAEVIVASNQDCGPLSRRYTTFRFLESEGANVFRLRALGVAAASGRLVALTEDHCTLAPGWLAALLAAYQAGHPVVGGPIDNGLRERSYDWALYLSEYGAYLPPVPEGPTGMLLAVNIAYDRELLAQCRDTWREVFYESEVRSALATVPLRMLADATVTSHLAMPFPDAVVHLFRGGRRYGRHRRSISPPLLRSLLPLAAPAVPFLLTGRVLRTVARRRPRLLWHAMRALPYVVALESAWGAGEMLGYLPVGED